MPLPIEWIILEIIVNTVEIGALFYLLCSKFETKVKNSLPLTLFVVGSIAILSLRTFIEVLQTVPIMESLVPIAGLIFLMFFREGQFLRKLFWTLLSYGLITIISLVSISVVSLVSTLAIGEIAAYDTSTERLVAMISTQILLVTVFYILSKRKRYSREKPLSAIPMIICFSIPLITTLVMLWFVVLIISYVDINPQLILAVAVSYLIINTIVFALYESIVREAEKNYDLIAQNQWVELTNEHNLQVVEMYEEMRHWQHDYNNHMQLILTMLEKINSADTGEVTEYIKKLYEQMQSSSLEIVTGNLVVDAIISAKATLASAHYIDFEYNIHLPDRLTIEDMELCSMLSNLFDNAIEACSKLGEGKPRYINFEMIMIKTQLYIMMANSSNGEYKIQNGKFKTTKDTARADLHGIGMSNIKSIVDKYGGLYDVDAGKDSFTTNISIPLVSKKVK